jgi:hypothetical protein
MEPTFAHKGVISFLDYSTWLRQEQEVFVPKKVAVTAQKVEIDARV